MGKYIPSSFFEQSKFFVLLNVPAHSAQPFQQPNTMQLLKEGTQIKPPAFRHRKIGSWSQARSSRSLTHSGETKDTRPTTTGSDYSHTVAFLTPNPFIISNLLMNLELNTYTSTHIACIQHGSGHHRLDQRFYVLTWNFEIPHVAYYF